MASASDVPADVASEILLLRTKVKWMDVLMKQNAALEGEVSRLCGELDEATRGVLKRGYLFKYRWELDSGSDAQSLCDVIIDLILNILLQRTSILIIAFSTLQYPLIVGTEQSALHPNGD